MTKTAQSVASRTSRKKHAERWARRYGYAFDPYSDRWQLSRDTTINLSWTSAFLTGKCARALRRALTYFAENYSAGHVGLLHDSFRKFVMFVGKVPYDLSNLTTASLLNYKASLGDERLHTLYLTSRLIRVISELKISHIDKSVTELLTHWRLKGGLKGVAVRTRDPLKGQLTDLEFEALVNALYLALESKSISIGVYTLTMLFVATGRRPTQLRDLKVKDLIVGRAADGLTTFILRIPRVKQSGRGDDPWRTEFKEVALDPEIGKVVELHIANVRQRAIEILRPGCEQLLGEVAMFPSWPELSSLSSVKKDLVRLGLESDMAHRTSSSISNAVAHCIDRLKVISERLGGPMHVFPYRLRRTLGVRAAREGYGQLVIAELLDHTDTQSVKVYTENVPENVNAINKAVAMHLAPIAQAFAGVLVDSGSQAVRGNDMGSRVRIDDGRTAGTCGKYGFCGALAPIACYTCTHFQPWVDGPHEEVLKMLLRDRERLRKATGDDRVTSVNDRTILAVAEVIELCNKRKRGLVR